MKQKSNSKQKVNINRLNMYFALALSVFTSWAGIAGNISTFAFLIVFLVIIMPIIVQNFEIITFTEDGKFLDVNKKEINVEKKIPGLPFVLFFFAIVMHFVLFLSIISSLPTYFNWCILSFSFFFIFTLPFIIKSYPIFVIFHPEFRKKYVSVSVEQNTLTSRHRRWLSYPPSYKSARWDFYNRTRGKL